VSVDGPFVGLLIGSNETVKHGLAAPPVGQVDVVVACAGKILGKIELGPVLAAANRVVIDNSRAIATRFFL